MYPVPGTRAPVVTLMDLLLTGMSGSGARLEAAGKPREAPASRD